MITDEQLDEWQKLAEEAHRGPWFVRYGTNPDYPHGVECGYPQQVISMGDVTLIGEFYDGTDVAPAVHAPFVAAARTAVPELIAEVRRLRAEVAERTEHHERTCRRCNGRNMANGRWAAASPLWNAIMRDGSIDGEWKYNEIICPLCFAELAEEQGIATDWRVDARTVNVELETVTPSGRVWNDETWLWEEPVEAQR